MPPQIDSVNKRAVVDYMQARADQDTAALERLLAPDFAHEMRGEHQDRRGLLAEVAAFPVRGSQVQIDALVEEGDQVACRYRWNATTIDGAPVTFTGLFIARLRDGQLLSGWGEYDSRSLRRAMSPAARSDQTGPTPP